MKTTFFLLSLILLASLLILSSCRKNDDFVLPKETTSGENTLGFKVDGEVYLRVPNNLFQPYNTVAKYDKFNEQHYLRLSAKSINKNEDMGFLSLEVKEPFHIGERLQLFEGNFSRYRLYDSGYVEFTRFDTIARIVSGRFNFSTKDSRTNEIIHITEGRFDLQLTEY